MSLISISQLVIVTKTQYASCELQIGILKIFDILKISKAYFNDIPISFQNYPPLRPPTQKNGDLLSFYTLRCLFFLQHLWFLRVKAFSSFTVPTLKSE